MKKLLPLALVATFLLGCFGPYSVVGPRPPMTATPDMIAVALDEVVLPTLYVANGIDALFLAERTKNMGLTARLAEEDKFYERWEVIWGEDERSGIFGTLGLAVRAWRAAVDVDKPDIARVAEASKRAREAFCHLRDVVMKASPEMPLPDLPFVPCPD